MASESDSDLIISKRSKKRPIPQDIEPSNTKSSNEEDLLMNNKHDSAVFNVDGFFEHKKAVKRTRESDEESSITSDDEVNIKKRIRKNSDLYRPKKVVSAAARKRREAAKTLRESKIAASETDSEYDSDENLKCEDASKRKQCNSDSENKILTDSEDYFSKKDIQKIEKPCEKGFQKNEDSSSAYNSDSQDGVHLQHKKEKKMIDSSKAENISLPSNIISCNKKKGEESINSGSELDEDNNGTLVLENKLRKEKHINDKKQKKCSQDSQESNNIHSDIRKEKNNKDSKNSGDEIVGQIKPTADVEDAEVKEKSVKQSLREQNTPKSDSENCSDDDQPLNKSKKMTVNEEISKQNRNSDSSEDDEDVLISKVKDQKIFKVNSPKKTLKIQNTSADSSDSDRPTKKTKTTQHLKQNKKKVVKQPSKKQYSSEEGSSDDEQPPKKTKSSSNKFQGISDSEESDNFTLKARVKEVKKSKNKVHLSSSDEEKPLKTPLKYSKTGNSKSNQRLGEELGSVKNEKSSSKKNANKGENVAKKPIQAHVPDGLSSSDDDRPLKKNKSSAQTKTKITEKGEVLNSATNQNSSDEKSSDDEQPLKKTKSHGTKILAASNSEDDIYQAKCKKMKNSKDRHQQSISSSDDDDKPLMKEKCVLNKKSSETNLKHEKKGIKQGNIEKKVSSDSEDNPIRFRGEKRITERIEIKKKKSETHASSEVSTNESSSDSDVPLSKTVDSRAKVVSEKTTAIKKDPKKISKHSAKFEDADSSDSENENFKKKPVSKCTEDDSTEAKKEISDIETSEKEGNSEDYEKKSSIKIKEMNDSDKQISDTPNKSLKISNKEFSDSAESSDSGDDKKVKKEEQSNSSKKSCDVRKQSVSTSCESDSDSSKKDKTKNKKKAPSKMVARINNLKKYIRASGIHINNYASVWEGCKSDKQRADRLSKFLADHGMKGRPTLQKCKKLRVKLEKKREVEELDLNNIIDDNENSGRYKCRSSRRQPTEKKNPEIDKEAAERAAELKQRFSRIKDLIESDSSSD